MRNTWILPVINRIGKRSNVCTIYPLDVPVATFKHWRAIWRSTSGWLRGGSQVPWKCGEKTAPLGPKKEIQGGELLLSDAIAIQGFFLPMA